MSETSPAAPASAQPTIPATATTGANPDAGKVRVTLHHAGQQHDYSRPFSPELADAITFVAEAVGMRVVRSLPL